MQSIFPDMEEIPSQLFDSGLTTDVVYTHCIVYKDDDKFNMVIFDALGTIVNIIELQPEDPSMEGENFTENTIAFCKVIMRDVFTDFTILSKKEVPIKVDKYLSKEVKKDKDFMKKMYLNFMYRNKSVKIVLN